MIKNTAFITNQQLHVKNGIAGYQIIWGLIIVFVTSVSAFLSSKYGLGLFSVWPVIILFLIFIKKYELGLICFVLSFSYQAPVVFDPSFGLSAVIRLDELFFIPIFLIWILRISVKQNKIDSNGPLTKPLLFYVLIAFLSLLVRYDTISSTPFLNTASGWRGLGPLAFKLIEVVGGYIILSDPRITQKTRNNLFRCLLIVATSALSINLLVSAGIFPKDILRETFSYDPHILTSRLALYGNTSAWGVLLICYFFIMLYSFFYLKPWWIRIILFLLFIFCIDSIFISGTKTAVIGLGIGLTYILIKEIKKFMFSIKTIILVFFVIIISLWLLNQLRTQTQREIAYFHLEEAYLATGIKGIEVMREDTSLGNRIDNIFRFGEAIEEEPGLLLLGRGWHRRTVYETGISLHNDLLTAVHDLGIGGGIFIIWLYWVMYKQFSNGLRNINTVNIIEKVSLLKSIMAGLVLVIIASSFTSENLTLYPGIDVQFSFIVTIMAVTWGYLKEQFKENPHYAFL